MSRLVDDLLLLARLDAHGPAGAPAVAVDVGRAWPRRPSPVDAARQWSSAGCTSSRARAAGRGAGAPRRAAPGPGQPGRQRRAARDRSEVVLAARSRGDRVPIRVADDGPGIPPEDRERVFERFTRLDDARARDAGGPGWAWPSSVSWCAAAAATCGSASPRPGGLRPRSTCRPANRRLSVVA